MHQTRSSGLFLFILALCTNIHNTLSDCAVIGSDAVYSIRSFNNEDWALDASVHQVQIQHFRNSSSEQLWYLLCGRKIGLFYIINAKTGLVLDVVRENPFHVITAANDTTLWQEWFLNGDGQIVNAAVLTPLYLHQLTEGYPIYLLGDKGEKWKLSKD